MSSTTDLLFKSLRPASKPFRVNWSYTAGIFDGEGNYTIGLAKCGVKLFAQFSGRGKHLIEIKNFLDKNNISAFHSFTDAKRTPTLIIAGHEDLLRFCEMIYPYLVLKREHTVIMLRALMLKSILRKKGFGQLKSNMALFDQLRHELHQLSLKGRLNLKEWNPC